MNFFSILFAMMFTVTMIAYQKKSSSYEKLEETVESLESKYTDLYAQNVEKNLKIYELYDRLDQCRGIK